MKLLDENIITSWDVLAYWDLGTLTKTFIRHLPRKERTKIIRKFIKDHKLNIYGLSITTPNYSMVNLTQIRLPRVPSLSLHEPLRVAAIINLRAILEAAFDVESRSDANSDHYDMVLSIN